MSLARDPGRTRKRLAKIEPNGCVYLGRRLNLEQVPVAPRPASYVRTSGLPQDGSIRPWENPTPLASPGMLPMQQLEYRLSEADDHVLIKKNGLMSSYGIFGVPGSGKTYLMLHLLRQMLAIDADDEARKFGGLVLDPKAALIDDMQDLAAQAGRCGDLVLLNAEDLAARDEYVNLIAVDLDAYELARALVLAAQSAGVGASEAYWFGAWQNLFGAAIHLLQRFGEQELTLRVLMDHVLTVEEPDAMLDNTRPMRKIQRLAADVRNRLDHLDEDERTEAETALNRLAVFYGQKADSIATVENLMTEAYGAFLRPNTRRYSPPGGARDATATPFYDQIIDSGKLVLVSVSSSESGLAEVVSTLVKNLFMQSVLSRQARVRSGRLQNFERPVLLACDEYGAIATEIPGKAGDGRFFSLCREQGCMGLLATQSVNVLQATQMKENWRSIFSNFGAKIFMRAGDSQTTEEATKVAGEVEWFETSLGSSSGAQGLGSSTQRNLKERKVLPGHVLTQVLATGQGVVVGSLDGRSSGVTEFFQVSEAP